MTPTPDMTAIRDAIVAGDTRPASLAALGVPESYRGITVHKDDVDMFERLDDPTKHWKFKPRDIDERAYWDAYMEAYSDAIERCNTDVAPWYVVPADRKWYRNWAVTKLLIEQLQEMSLVWPEADFDVDAERARLLAPA